jgi:hypothetical protein
MIRTRVRHATLLAVAVVGCAGPPPEEPGPPALEPVVAAPGEFEFEMTEPYATDGNLPFFHDLYTFRGEDGATAVVASFAVRAADLSARRFREFTRYRFSLGLRLADTRTSVVRQVHDSVYLTVPRPLDDDHVLHAFVRTSAAPSHSTVQHVVLYDRQHPGYGQLYAAPSPIPDYSGNELMISDIALGLPGRQGAEIRPGVQLSLLPSDYFPGGDFDVYYEVYNLPAGYEYATEVEFVPLDDPSGTDPDGPDPVRVRFDATSDARGGVLQEQRRVGVPAEAGQYRMTVTVTNLATGETAARSRRLRIRPWAEGATLLPTCPDRMGETRPGC